MIPFMRDNPRRSKFWLVTYSIACNRVIKFDPIANLYVTGDGAYVGADEMAREQPDCLILQHRVGIDHEENFALRLNNAEIERVGLPAILLSKHFYDRMIGVGGLGDVRRSVRRTVVDNQDFQHPIISSRKHRGNCLQNDFGFVERGYQHGHRRKGV